MSHKSDPQLRWWYGQANKLAFGGRLPDIPIFYPNKWNKFTDCIGGTEFLAGNPILICIHRSLKRIGLNIVLGVLFHEMVHVAHPLWSCGNSRRFAKEVARVILKVRPAVL